MSVWKDALYLWRQVRIASPGRIFLQSLVQALSFTYGSFYTLVFFRFLLDSPALSRPFSEVAWFLLLFFLLGLGVGLAKTWFSQLYLPRSDERIAVRFQTMVYEQASRVDLARYEDPRFYDAFVKSAGDVAEKVRQSLEVLSHTAALLWTLLLTTAYAVAVEPRILAVCAPTAAAVFFLEQKRARAAYSHERARVPDERRLKALERAVSLPDTAKELRLYPVFPALLQDFRAALGRLGETALREGKKVALWRFFSEFGLMVFLNTSLYMLIVWRYLVDNAFSLGNFASLTGAAINFCHFLEDLADNFTSLSQTALYAGSLRTFLEAEPETRDGPDEAPPMELLRLDNVSFRYPGGGERALRGVTFSLRRGEKIALVGRGGAGKSTLVKVLTRLYDPQEGRVLLNGQDIRGFTLESYRGLFATCLQDAPVFAATVAENVKQDEVLPGDGPAVREALLRGGALPFVDALPRREQNELTREFDEDGAMPSGGERQKIALSAALYRDARVLLVDEPSSALDPIAESRLFEDLMRGGADRTLLFISHRLSSATLADRIVCLDGGAVCEEGTHRELMEKNGIYAEMFRRQAERYAMGGDADEG